MLLLFGVGAVSIAPKKSFRSRFIEDLQMYDICEKRLRSGTIVFPRTACVWDLHRKSLFKQPVVIEFVRRTTIVRSSVFSGTNLMNTTAKDWF